MTYESMEAIELGQAEALIEFGMPFTEEELDRKYVPSVELYVEFE